MIDDDGTHDPLCPLSVDGVEGPLDLYECPCDLIARVREDERLRLATPSWKYPFPLAPTVRQS